MTIINPNDIESIITERRIGVNTTDRNKVCFEAIVTTRMGEMIVAYYWTIFSGLTPWRSAFLEERPSDLIEDPNS